MPRSVVVGLLLIAACARVASASPPRFTRPYLEAVDRNGGSLEAGDVIDWSLLVTNRGDTDGGLVLVEDTLTASEELADAGTARFDPATRRLQWDQATNPEFGRIQPDGSVLLHFTTRLITMPSGRRLCHQATSQGMEPWCWPDDCPSDDALTAADSDPTCLPRLWTEPCRGALAGSTPFEMTGRSLRAGSTVQIGASSASVLTSVDGMLRALSPAAAAPGAAEIVVRDDGGTEMRLGHGWWHDEGPGPGPLLMRKVLGRPLRVELHWTPADRPVALRTRVERREPCSSRFLRMLPASPDVPDLERGDPFLLFDID